MQRLARLASLSSLGACRSWDCTFSQHSPLELVRMLPNSTTPDHWPVPLSIPWSTSRSGRLQLHWGAALREGMAPAQPAGPGWKTSASHNWESSGCTLVTPFTVRRVPALGIGQRYARRPPSSAQGASTVSGDYCALAYASDGGVVGSAPALKPAPATTEVPEKQAHVVLLDLPLEGMLM